MHLPARALRAWIGAVACVAVAVAVAGVGVAGAETEPKVSGKIEWGLWVDADGCQHWWADGGEEGYMVARVNLSTGKPICAAKSTCLLLYKCSSIKKWQALQMPFPDKSVHPFAGWVMATFL